jgi:hypothetical protein
VSNNESINVSAAMVRKGVRVLRESGLLSGKISIFVQSPKAGRRCHPYTLAGFAGRDARLDVVVRQLRSKCNWKKCTARTVGRDTVPRGYKSH